MARYLVTGGAGFIGSHLVDHLLAAGHEVMVVDDFSTGRRENLAAHPRLTVLEGDILEMEAKQFPQPFEGVAHLAAWASVNDSWTSLRRAHEVNLSATVRVLDLARVLQIPRVVYASSAAVYGAPARIPIREDDAAQPLSPYGLQKLAGEHYGRLLAQEEGPTFVALRFFNVFGPRQVASSPYSGVISKFAAAFRSGGPIKINGDGRQTRDFVYVADLTRGLSAALAAPGLPPFTVCNLGTGNAITIRALAETMRLLFPGWSGAVEHGPALPGDIVHSQATIEVARRLLGYEPKYSLETGLAEMQRKLEVG
ncbi:MAG: NAD-dependent epimerase/dehydratase family protein [Chthoniobacterales bacterium]